MDKYKKLVSNTVIFAIGTFSSKLLVFLLMPLYTRVLTESDYGVVDLLMQTGNLLLPLVSLGINNAIIRFGLDKSSDSREVFTGGLATLASGYAVFLVAYPLLRWALSLAATTCSRSISSEGVWLIPGAWAGEPNNTSAHRPDASSFLGKNALIRRHAA